MRPAELLDRERILGALSGASAAWLDELEIFDEIDSTSTRLTELSTTADVHGRVCMAERQTAGRGRRGRQWHSPSGRNIALSLGRRFPLGADQLRSLSLAIGLAVADAVAGQGVDGVTLKWPNDVLLGGGKLGGILIELVKTGADSTVVIGVGLNVGSATLVQGEIDQTVADVLDGNPDVSRNALAAGLVNAIVDYCQEFERSGFEPMRAAWTELHAYHDQPVRVRVGDVWTDGVVRGVTDTGELQLENEAGIVTAFNAGEVSLRPR